MTIREIHIKTIEKYGRLDNINKAIQELNELIEELRDKKNGEKNSHKIQEEIADVRNMCDKLEIIFNLNPKETKEIQLNKMVRTLQRLETL